MKKASVFVFLLVSTSLSAQTPGIAAFCKSKDMMPYATEYASLQPGSVYIASKAAGVGKLLCVADFASIPGLEPMQPIDTTGGDLSGKKAVNGSFALALLKPIGIQLSGSKDQAWTASTNNPVISGYTYGNTITFKSKGGGDCIQQVRAELGRRESYPVAIVYQTLATDNLTYSAQGSSKVGIGGTASLPNTVSSLKAGYEYQRNDGRSFSVNAKSGKPWHLCYSVRNAKLSKSGLVTAVPQFVLTFD